MWPILSYFIENKWRSWRRGGEWHSPQQVPIVGIIHLGQLPITIKIVLYRGLGSYVHMLGVSQSVYGSQKHIVWHFIKQTLTNCDTWVTSTISSFFLSSKLYWNPLIAICFYTTWYSFPQQRQGCTVTTRLSCLQSPISLPSGLYRKHLSTHAGKYEMGKFHLCS